jgi:acetyl-CoA synthetase
LQSLGFAAGDILFTFLPKTPEQFFSFLGSLKLQVIGGTIFSNFGDDALLDRLGDYNTKGIVRRNINHLQAFALKVYSLGYRH